MYKYKHGGLHSEQELKLPGGRRSWRDEARFRLQEALGETGERLGEGLLGESEEDKYLEFLQREYGSELPRDEEGNIDVPLSRPMRESMLDMSDLGMADKTLMILSGGGSIFPRAALSSGLLESGMLMGDAKAMIDRGETVAGGVTAALAGLPPAVAAAANKKTFADLGNEAVSGIGQFMKRNVPSIERNSMVTPEGVELPLYFSKGSGNMTGGGNKMTELQGMQENFPKLLNPTKGSSMRDIIDDPEINTGDLENALNKYNLGFDDMKRIDIDSPEIYNNSSVEGRDLLEELELLTYPRKQPIYSQEYNEGMGTLDFYDTKSGPIGIMQMDIDDSIDDVVFFIPRSKNVTGKQTQTQTLKQTQTENIENMSDSELDAFIASNEDRLADYADDVARGNQLSPEISKSRTTFENRNRIAREVQLNRRKEELIRNHEAMTERMPPDQARRSFPQDEIDEIDEQLYNLAGSSNIDKTKLRDLENLLFQKNNIRNAEYGTMSVKNLGKLDQEIGKLKAEIIALKG